MDTGDSPRDVAPHPPSLNTPSSALTIQAENQAFEKMKKSQIHNGRFIAFIGFGFPPSWWGTMVPTSIGKERIH